MHGEVAIVDPTGPVARELRTALDPATIARAARKTRRARSARRRRGPPGRKRSGRAPTHERVLGPVPDLTVVERPPARTSQREKEWLTRRRAAEAARHLALVVVHPRRGRRRQPAAASYGTYDLYVPRNSTITGSRTRRRAACARRSSRARLRGAAASIARTIDATDARDRPPSVIGRRKAPSGRQSARFNRVAAVRFRRAAGVRHHDRRTVADDLDGRGEVEPRRRGPAVRGVADGADGRQALGQMGVSLRRARPLPGAGRRRAVSFAMFGLLDPWLVVLPGRLLRHRLPGDRRR